MCVFMLETDLYVTSVEEVDSAGVHVGFLFGVVTDVVFHVIS